MTLTPMANEADDAHEVDERAHDGDRPEAADEADHGEGEEQREEQQAERAAARVLASAARHAPPAMRTPRPAVVTVGRATRHQAAPPGGQRRVERTGSAWAASGPAGCRTPPLRAKGRLAAAWLRAVCGPRRGAHQGGGGRTEKEGAGGRGGRADLRATMT